MPYPPLADYDCLFSLFNPNAEPSAGELVLFDPRGKRLVAQGYKLAPRASTILDLNAGKLIDGLPTTRRPEPAARMTSSGLLGVINERGTAKSFGYLMIRRPAEKRFSVEHPIHQGVAQSKTSTPAFDVAGQFKAKNILYTTDRRIDLRVALYVRRRIADRTRAVVLSVCRKRGGQGRLVDDGGQKARRVSARTERARGDQTRHGRELHARFCAPLSEAEIARRTGDGLHRLGRTVEKAQRFSATR
jgi:hypothetical protein